MAEPELKRFMDALDVSSVELAEEMGVKVQRIRQARMDTESAGHRSAPEGWEDALHSITWRRMSEAVGILADLRGFPPEVGYALEVRARRAFQPLAQEGGVTEGEKADAEPEP